MIGLLVIVALGLTRILEPADLFYGFSNEAVITIGAMFVVSAALDLIATELIGRVGQLGLYGTFWIFYFMTGLLSLLILNKPAAVLATPLAILLALKLEVDPKPFIMAVAFAASTAMATSMGYQTKLLVYGPGGYNFKDFVKFGLPLNILTGILACLLIPVLWPFR